jgi:hypothetical protein
LPALRLSSISILRRRRRFGLFNFLPCIPFRLDNGQSAHRIPSTGRAKHLYHFQLDGTAGADGQPTSRLQSFDGINPKDPKVPAVIAGLRPRSVSVSKDGDCLVLGLHGGFDRYDAIALSENAPASSTNGLSGDLQLIPGLWFNDEELLYQGTDREAYVNQLRALKPADAPPPKW